MPVANWSSRFETGIERIDAQHQSLFEAVNQMAESFRTGAATAQAQESLAFVVRYAQDHFQTEEAYMREMGYPALATHQGHHAHLLAEIAALQARAEAGRPLTMAVTIFLADWLQHHIDEVDMDYVNFVKDKNRE